MDYRVKTSNDLAINLAHAKAVITACRVAIPRIAVSDEDEAFIRLRIMRMISELETIDKFASKTAVTVKQRRANAKSQADRDRASARARMGMHADADHTAGGAVPAASTEPGDGTAVRKLA